MKKILLAVCLLAVLAGCSTFRKDDPLPVAGQINLDRFMGQWHVIAAVPTILDRSAHNTTKTYERWDRGIKIAYEFEKGEFGGELKSYNTKAVVDNPGINSDWEVRIVTWPFETDYKILHIEDDYSVAVIGQPSRKYVWIMSRTKTIDDPVYSDIILYLQDLGYDVGKIRRIPQR
jgi:apolipoprotein D and lipocalin family protein